MSDIFTEAERVLSGLKSHTPGFDAVADAAALIYRFVSEHRGPDGFATWKEAAVAERVRRVKAEARAAHQPDAVHPDTARLDYLIKWLGFNEDVSQLPVRDWNDDDADARLALDEALARRASDPTSPSTTPATGRR